MGPTIQENNALDFAHEFTKNHSLELKVIALGYEKVVEVLEGKNREVLKEHTCERASK
jgi:hypothetical protein